MSTISQKNFFTLISILTILIAFNIFEEKQFKDWSPFYRGSMGILIHIIVGVYLAFRKIILPSKITTTGFIIIHCIGIFMWSYLAIAVSDDYNPVPNAIAFGFIPATLFISITIRYQKEIQRQKYIQSGTIRPRDPNEKLSIKQFPKI